MINRFLNRHGSTILTCLGAAGVVATSVLAVKNTPKAMRLLEKAKEEKCEELTTIETIKTAAPAYIPAASVGLSTIACIFGANVLNKKQQATLTAAYALLSESYKEYKAKTKQIFGADADNAIKAEVAASKYEAKDISGDKQLFFDFLSMEYFESTLEEVMKALDEADRIAEQRGYVYLHELYDLLGVTYNYPHVGYIQALYNVNGGSIGFEIEKCFMDDGLECYIISTGDDVVTECCPF